MVFMSWEFQPSYLQRSLKVFFELVGTQAAGCALISILLNLLLRPDWVKCSRILCMLKWMMVLVSLWLFAAKYHQRLFETICLRCPYAWLMVYGKHISWRQSMAEQLWTFCFDLTEKKLGHAYPRGILKSKHWKAACIYQFIFHYHSEHSIKYIDDE